ncbi:hypothetical protein GCM10011316_25840 [Roseibium aquae]|uniref:Uncharacterized protein n=1 Tax=Roseibium aquae TaxID=1323746 RepID=A0A916TKQ1_9HYPH|nr:hypothetical protein GCM10011316_25840 [Roseibium aquae]
MVHINPSDRERASAGGLPNWNTNTAATDRAMTPIHTRMKIVAARPIATSHPYLESDCQS